MGRKLTLPDGFEKHNFIKMMKQMKHGRNRIIPFVISNAMNESILYE
jgi:hypothetical protein